MVTTDDSASLHYLNTIQLLLCLVYKLISVLPLLSASVAEDILSKRFGELVRRLRLEKGYSQEDLAFRVNLHQTYISSVERGERNVTIGTANRIAKALGTQLSSIFVELERPSTDY